MMKNKLKFLTCALVVASLLLCGCQQNGKGDKKTGKTQDSPNSLGITVESIELALIDKDNRAKEYKKLQSFSAGNSGPYTISEKAETAYVTLRLNASSKTVENFAFYVRNRNTYEKKVTLKKKAGDGETLFNAEKNIVLAKGKNTLDILIEIPGKTPTAEYKIVVEYDGGPDFSDPAGTAPTALIPGIYCPAQRAEEDDDSQNTEPYLWAIFIAGNCGYCPLPLNAAGKSEKLATKFKNKGLRVVAIEDSKERSQNLYNPAGALAKWKDSGRGYNMYTSEHNCLNFMNKNCAGYPSTYFYPRGKLKGASGPERKYIHLINRYFGIK